jgi:4-hydroxy-tetrahydrodipicolinate synthase
MTTRDRGRAGAAGERPGAGPASDPVVPQRSGLAGLWAPTLTPLEADGSIAHGRLGEHAARLLDEGCDGIVLFGTTGEAPSFARDERQEALERLARGGFPADRLVVGTGCAAVTDAVALTRHARALGARAVLVLPPFYYKMPPPAGLVAYFDAVFAVLAGGATAGLLYNFPRLSGIALTPALIGELAPRYGPLLAGVKDSSGDRETTLAFCRLLAGRAVFPGTESVLTVALAAGACGLISATANVAATRLRARLDAWHAGDRVGAERLQAEAVAARAPFVEAGMIPALKAALAERLGDPGWRRVRPPWMAAAGTPGPTPRRGVR